MSVVSKCVFSLHPPSPFLLPKEDGNLLSTLSDPTYYQLFVLEYGENTIVLANYHSFFDSPELPMPSNKFISRPCVYDSREEQLAGVVCPLCEPRQSLRALRKVGCQILVPSHHMDDPAESGESNVDCKVHLQHSCWQPI